MARTGFLRLFWGFLFVDLDVKLNQLDILPDWLGYLLIISALGRLARLHRSFQLAQHAAAVSLLLYLLGPIRGWLNGLLGALLLIPRIPDVTVLAAEAVMVWLICAGIVFLARMEHLEPLERSAIARRNAYLAALVMLAVLPQLLESEAELLSGLAIGLAVAALIFALLFLGLLRTAARLLGHVTEPPLVVLTPEQQAVEAVRWRRISRGLVVVCLLLAAWSLNVIVFGRPPQARELLVLPGDHAAGSLGGKSAFSPDGRRIAAISPRDMIRVWDADTGGELVVIDGPGDIYFYDLAFSPDGQRLATVGGLTLIWDAESGRELRRMPERPYDPQNGDDTAHRVVFSPDGALIATVSDNIRLYDAATGALRREIKDVGTRSDFGRSLAFSPDGSEFVTGGWDRVLQRWHGASGSLIDMVRLERGEIHAVAYSPDGKLIATANDGNVVYLWDKETRRPIREIVVSTPLDWLVGRRPHSHVSNWATAVAFSADGRLLAIGSSDASAGVWDVASGAQLFELNGHSDYVLSVAFSPDGRRVLTSGADATVRLWALE